MRAWIMVLALAASGLAQAQSTPAKKELAAKLVALQQTGIQNVGRQIAGQTSQRALQAAGRALPRVAADKREAAAKEVQADVKKFFDEVEPMLRERAGKLAPAVLQPIYEEKFSEDELKQVIAWLESPVSKKFQQVDGEAAKALAEKLVADSRPTIEAKLKTLEATVAGRLGLQPGSAASAPAKK
jgi:hypothetical protein